MLLNRMNALLKMFKKLGEGEKEVVGVVLVYSELVSSQDFLSERVSAILCVCVSA